MPPRIFVAGYYGFGNEGDEAILEGLRSTVAELRSDTAWVVTSGAPSLTTRRHGVRAIHWREPAAIASEIAACDLVIVGGGGLFQDYWGCDVSTLFTPEHANITFYGLPVILAGLLGKPAVLYAVGVGPLRTPEGRAFVCALATSATSVSVRDEGSREALVQSGVPHRLVHLGRPHIRPARSPARQRGGSGGRIAAPLDAAPDSRRLGDPGGRRPRPFPGRSPHDTAAVRSVPDRIEGAGRRPRVFR